MKFFSPPHPLPDAPTLSTYAINFSLNRLVPGVDNIRYDVYLSPALCKATRKLAMELITHHSNASMADEIRQRTSGAASLNDDFKKNCTEVLMAAINKAKLSREIQINFLAQAAVAKMILEEIRGQYNEFITKCRKIIRQHEISQNKELDGIIKMKEEFAELQNQKNRIIQDAATDIFQYMVEAQHQELRKIREANFGAEALLPDDFFSNPLIHVDNDVDDFFMIKEYVLLGNRLEDPVRYDNMLSVLRDFLCRLIPEADLEEMKLDKILPDALSEESASEGLKLREPKVDLWLKADENIDMLFNVFDSEKHLTTLKAQKKKQEVKILKKRMNGQKTKLNHLYAVLKKADMLKGIVASYEIQPFFKDYCPPLYPYEILKYLINPKERGAVTVKIKRLKSSTGKSLSLVPLRKATRSVSRCKVRKKKKACLQYIKGFIKYHRDLQNFILLKYAMDWINLATDEKTQNLSRVNHTLNEFLLPREQIYEEKPIANHVILKTDVRGSTDITHQIKERGLNPASYFSLNFFNPITAILEDYGASKVFIEGDAIILAIFEKEDTPQDWYGVARACGLAINMLLITQRYNTKSKKHRFPALEQGIGICYRNNPPTFLFDGDNRIMISPAINHADRLSSCTKSVKKWMKARKPPFNLYVYQTASEEDMTATRDDLFARYNVNGIELNKEGFEKLKEEINLIPLKCYIPDLTEEKFKIYTGIFPTISGKYQRLVIREAPIPVVSADTFKTERLTTRNYYEVCTNLKIYEFAKKKTRGGG